ncbi:hypothetical protein EX895_001180 [Sporisorium graminicola]|uniref:Uncharacterized protein n=1 Tax=Sporisorium graminicola TaxID=280036 RepID=A0A4U7KYP8_9BASI|nr:hypothetical protein EX895_001180 [Sporisorium graminicola]TKY89883.1 hypothetical protein EX895_001180 [Sporisorium graminicola]
MTSKHSLSQRRRHGLLPLLLVLLAFVGLIHAAGGLGLEPEPRMHRVVRRWSGDQREGVPPLAGQPVVEEGKFVSTSPPRNNNNLRTISAPADAARISSTEAASSAEAPPIRKPARTDLQGPSQSGQGKSVIPANPADSADSAVSWPGTPEGSNKQTADVTAAEHADRIGMTSKIPRRPAQVIINEDGKLYLAAADRPSQRTRIRSALDERGSLRSSLRRARWALSDAFAKYKPNRFWRSRQTETAAAAASAAEPRRKGVIVLRQESNGRTWAANSADTGAWTLYDSGARRASRLRWPSAWFARLRSAARSAVSKLHRRALEGDQPGLSDTKPAASEEQDTRTMPAASERVAPNSLSTAGHAPELSASSSSWPQPQPQPPTSGARARLVRFETPPKLKADDESEVESTTKPSSAQAEGRTFWQGIRNRYLGASGSAARLQASSSEPQPVAAYATAPEQEAPRGRDGILKPTSFLLDQAGSEAPPDPEPRKAVLQAPNVRAKGNLGSAAAKASGKLSSASLAKFLIRRPASSSSSPSRNTAQATSVNTPERDDASLWRWGEDWADPAGVSRGGWKRLPTVTDPTDTPVEHSGPSESGSVDAKGKTVVEPDERWSAGESSSSQPRHQLERTPSDLSTDGSFHTSSGSEVGSEPASPRRPLSRQVSDAKASALAVKQGSAEAMEPEAAAAEAASGGRLAVDPQFETMHEEAVEKKAAEAVAPAAEAAAQGRLLVDPRTKMLVDDAARFAPGSSGETDANRATSAVDDSVRDGKHHPLAQSMAFEKPPALSLHDSLRWKLHTLRSDYRDFGAVGRDHSLAHHYTTAGVPALYSWSDEHGTPVMPSEARRLAQQYGEVRVFRNPHDAFDQYRLTYDGELRPPGDVLLPETDPHFHTYKVPRERALPTPRAWRDSGLTDAQKSARAVGRMMQAADGTLKPGYGSERWPIRWDRTRAELAAKARSVRGAISAAPDRAVAFGKTVPQRVSDMSNRLRGWYATHQSGEAPSEGDAQLGRLARWKESVRQSWAKIRRHSGADAIVHAPPSSSDTTPAAAAGLRELRSTADTASTSEAAQSSRPPASRWWLRVDRGRTGRPSAAESATSWKTPFREAVGALEGVKSRITGWLPTNKGAASTAASLTEHSHPLRRRRLHRRRL